MLNHAKHGKLELEQSCLPSSLVGQAERPTAEEWRQGNITEPGLQSLLHWQVGSLPQLHLASLIKGHVNANGGRKRQEQAVILFLGRLDCSGLSALHFSSMQSLAEFLILGFPETCQYCFRFCLDNYERILLYLSQ